MCLKRAYFDQSSQLNSPITDNLLQQGICSIVLSEQWSLFESRAAIGKSFRQINKFHLLQLRKSLHNFFETNFDQ